MNPDFQKYEKNLASGFVDERFPQGTPGYQIWFLATLWFGVSRNICFHSQIYREQDKEKASKKSWIRLLDEREVALRDSYFFLQDVWMAFDLIYNRV